MYHYNLDSLIFRDRLAFGWGWFVDLEARVFPVRVVLQHADDSVSTILCLRSGTRTDVADAFPDVNHAAASGFMIQGRLDSDSPVSTARLVLAGVDGNVGGTEIELGALASMLQQDVRATVSRGIRILRRRSFSANLGIVAKRLRIHVREALAARRSISGRRNAILILDHDLGGGSNAFRRQMIGRLRQTSPVYLITPRVQTLDYYLTLYDGVVESGQVYERLADLLQFLDGESWASIVINELVSYPDPMAMVKWLSARASVVPASTDFVLYLHDFYSVCPQWTLVGRRGVYCGVPDFEECTRCIK
ncbi:MAG TPA: hypothetical protein VN039_15185, partial [Nitrospira sp.]|nr:hypothetical protein [Nitrospira sp.]